MWNETSRAGHERRITRCWLIACACSLPRIALVARFSSVRLPGVALTSGVSHSLQDKQTRQRQHSLNLTLTCTPRCARVPTQMCTLRHARVPTRIYTLRRARVPRLAHTISVGHLGLRLARGSVHTSVHTKQRATRRNYNTESGVGDSPSREYSMYSAIWLHS